MIFAVLFGIGWAALPILTEKILLGAVLLLGRSGSTAVKICAGAAIVGIAALLVCTLNLKKNSGVMKLGGENVQLFGAKTDYRLALGIPALCLAAVLLTLAVPMFAFYATWVLAIVAFMLAVYYTVKLM